MNGDGQNVDWAARCVERQVGRWILGESTQYLIMVLHLCPDSPTIPCTTVVVGQSRVWSDCVCLREREREREGRGERGLVCGACVCARVSMILIQETDNEWKKTHRALQAGDTQWWCECKIVMHLFIDLCYVMTAAKSTQICDSHAHFTRERHNTEQHKTRNTRRLSIIFWYTQHLLHVSPSVLGEGSLLCGSSWGFFHFFPVKGFFWGSFSSSDSRV